MTLSTARKLRYCSATDWLNNFDDTFSYTTPIKTVAVGMASYHEDYYG